MRTKSPFNRHAVETDLTVFLVAFTNTHDVRIRFDEGGFIRGPFYRHVYLTMMNRLKRERVRDEKKFIDDYRPVEIVARVDDENLVEMEVSVKLPADDPRRPGGKVKKVLRGFVCEEIFDRLKEAEAALVSYSKDEDDEVGAQGSGRGVDTADSDLAARAV